MIDRPDPQTLWQSQPTEVNTMSAAELQTHADTFQTRIYRRNLREYVLSGMGFALFAFMAVRTTDIWMRAADLLIVAGLAVYVFVLLALGRANRNGAAAAADCRQFHIGELQRQRNLIRSVWFWGIAPALPGLILFLGRRFVLTPAKAQPILILAYAVAALILMGVIVLNLLAARHLQKQIDALG